MWNMVRLHVRANFKRLLMYKTASFLSFLGAMCQVALFYCFWRGICDADWETLRYVLLARFFFFFVCSNNIWAIAGDIKSGKVALHLTKPIRYLALSFIDFLSRKLTVFVVQGIPLIMFLLFFVNMKVRWVSLFLCALSVFVSLVICYCLDFLLSFLCTLTRNHWGVSALRDGIVQISSGAVVPLHMFPLSVGRAMETLPFAYMIDTPVRILTASADAAGALSLQLVYCVLMVALSVAADAVFTKRLQIQGG